MESLIYFALWTVLVFLMMRMGSGAHAMGHGYKRAESGPGIAGGPRLRWVAPEKDTDPVCRKTVSTDKAKSAVYAGNVYYFCSRDCREIFEAAPDLYVGFIDTNQQNLEHSHV